MNLRSFIVPGALVALLAVACEDAPPPPQPAQRAAPAAQPKVEEAPVAEAPKPPPYVYAYAPVGKRDPFRSPFVDKPGEAAERVCDEGPLAQWDVTQLALVATVTSDASPMAMLEDPSGKGHVIRRNSMVGRMCGKVTEVLRECITVTEYYPAPDGKRVPNPKKLCLKGDVSKEEAVDLGTGKKL